MILKRECFPQPNPSVSAKSGDRRGGLDTVRGIAAAIENGLKLPPSSYSEIFQICCVQMEFDKIKKIMKKQADRGGPLARRSESSKLDIEVVFTSLWIIGSKKMQAAICEQGQIFAPLVRKHWGSLILIIMDVFEISKSAGSKRATASPVAHLDILTILCDAMISLSLCNSLSALIKSPGPGPAVIFKFAWILWLSGGLRMPESPSSRDFNSSAVRCLSILEKSLDQDDLFFKSAWEACSAYGGIRTAVNIATSAFHCCTKSKERIEDVRFHLAVSSTLDRPPEGCSVWEKSDNATCEKGEISKLIEAVTLLATHYRGTIRKLGFLEGIDMILLRLSILFLRSHRNVEVAVRTGLLQMFLALDLDRGDLETVEVHAGTILRIIPRYFIYHSVIKVSTEEMRKITEGNEIKDGCLSEGGRYAEPWQTMKHVLLDRYCLMRFFDIVISPGLKVGYCNSASPLHKYSTFLLTGGGSVVERNEVLNSEHAIASRSFTVPNNVKLRIGRKTIARTAGNATVRNPSSFATSYY